MTNEVVIEGNNNFCQNPDCPNDHVIEVTIFKGVGYCSADCQKVLGRQKANGNMVFLTKEEESVIRGFRQVVKGQSHG